MRSNWILAKCLLLPKETIDLSRSGVCVDIEGRHKYSGSKHR